MSKRLSSLLLIFFIVIFLIYCGTDSETVDFSQRYTETCKNFSLTGIFDEQGKRIDDNKVNEAKVSWCLLSFEDKSHMQFNGVGRYGSCTGSLLDTESENILESISNYKPVSCANPQASIPVENLDIDSLRKL